MSKLVIFSKGEKLWYKSPSTKSNDLKRNPVGKGSSNKKPKVTKTRASAKAPPKVVNPIFKEMIPMTPDPFWKTLFDEASIGKFNRGLCFNNNCLTYKSGNKTTPCSIDGMEIEEAMVTMQTFMRTTASIISSLDKQIQSEELKRIASENIQLSSGSTPWSQIRSINNQTTLVTHYVTSIGAELNLNCEEENELINLIMIGIFSKRFNSKNIHMFNSVIHRIDGLVRREDGTFEIDPVACPLPCYPKVQEVADEEDDKSSSNVNFTKLWGKFVKDATKKQLDITI